MSDQPSPGPEASTSSQSPEHRPNQAIPPFKPRPQQLQPEAPPAPRRKQPNLTVVFMMITVGLTAFPLLWDYQVVRCPNDASRWDTIYFLVHHGTYDLSTPYEVGWTGGQGKKPEDFKQMSEEEKQGADWVKIGEKYRKMPWNLWGMPPWFTIDMVMIRDEKLQGKEKISPEDLDGQKFISSKPPFLPTLLAGVAWSIEYGSRHLPWEQLHEIFPSWRTEGFDWDRRITEGDPPQLVPPPDPWWIMTLTLVVSQILPFCLFIGAIAWYFRHASKSWWAANFCIAVAAIGTYLTPYLTTLNNHVFGAMATLFAVIPIVHIWYNHRRQWYWFALAGFFAGFALAVELPAGALLVAVFLMLLVKSPVKTFLVALPFALIPIGFAIYTNLEATDGQYWYPVQVLGNDSEPYDYPGSYWTENQYKPDGPDGMDDLHEDKGVYLFHLTLGHHGFFLLTPVFFLSLLGMVRHFLRFGEKPQPGLALMVLLVSAAAFAAVVLKTSSYGGGCQGPRWLFWLIPLWLLMLPAGVNALCGRGIGRFVCYVLLAVSLFSVFFALPHPNDDRLWDSRVFAGPHPWSNSWAHIMFRKHNMPTFLPEWMAIDY